jgi:NTP pyrophosphatase (non-canonical NTP hydrolase)
MPLSFDELRAANARRQDEWEDGTTEPFGMLYHSNALAGEVGEACNVVKKLERQRRGARGSNSTIQALADELADVIIYADLLARSAGIDLGQAVRFKFDATSEKYGLSTKLGEG